MISLKVICVGSLKESYLCDAVAEYTKRLGAFCKLSLVELKEEKLPDTPNEAQIEAALSREAEKIFSALPKRAYKIALCIEGKQLSSEELSAKLDAVCQTHSEVCLVIGSSHGLSKSVKQECDMALSFSRLTFPHQLMRVILLEAVYRAFSISRGTNYHK